MANPKLILGALNISADPHPSGVYRRLFSQVANKGVQLWGNDWGKITEPQDRETDPPSFYGRVLLWTEIDRTHGWLNQENNKEATPEEMRKVRIPDELDPNFRSFNFVFMEGRHLLVVEYRNELGQHFGAQRAQRLFSRLFARENLEEDDPEVSVTVVPSHEALEKIYSIPRLRFLEIFVIRPNADDVTSDANRLLDRLVAQGAKSQNLQLEKKAKEKTLKPDEQTKALAEIAATNGHVTGEGKDADGKPIMESTKDHPKTAALEVTGPTSLGTFFSGLRFF